MKLVKFYYANSDRVVYVNPENVIHVRREGEHTSIAVTGTMCTIVVNADITYAIKLLRVGSIDPKCADCVFYAHDTCRKLAADVFPVRAKDDWCGEYQEK